MDPIVHFEVPVDDLARAKKFYGSIFAWELEDYPMQNGSTYTGARTTPVDPKTFIPKTPGAINGGIFKRSKDVPTPIITIRVASIDDYAKKIEGAGGTMVKSRTEIPTMGYYGYFKDTEGNAIGLWEDLKK